MIIVERSVAEKRGVTVGRVLGPEELVRGILDALGRGEPVVAAFRGAWALHARIRERIVGEGLNPYLYAPVDDSELAVASRHASSDALLAAKHEMVASGAAPRAHVRVSTRKPVRRRDLLRLRLTRIYEYHPGPVLLDPGACASLASCTRCLEACPAGALRGKPPRLDTGSCTGCALCTHQCPLRVLSPPGVTPGSLSRGLRLLREGYEGPGIVVAACSGSLPRLPPLDVSRWHGVLPVVVPVECPGWLTPFHAVEAALLGFHSAVLCDRGALEECPAGNGLDAMRELAGTVFLGLHTSMDSLERAAQRLPPLPNAGSAPRLLLSLGASGGLAAPLAGVVRVDGEKCILCNACSRACPEGALRLVSDVGGTRLLFRHDSCTGCTLCVDACPTGAIRVEHAVDPGMAGEWAVLAGDEVARCRRCGAPLGSKSKIARLERALRSAGLPEEVVERVWLCEKCKAESLLGRGRLKSR